MHSVVTFHVKACLFILSLIVGVRSSLAQQPLPKSFYSMITNVIRRTFNDANISAAKLVDTFSGIDFYEDYDLVVLFKPVPCNHLCYQCWQLAPKNVSEKCEDFCEGFCGWRYRQSSGALSRGRKRNLVEVCLSILPTSSGAGGLLGGLLGGILGGSIYSSNKITGPTKGHTDGQYKELEVNSSGESTGGANGGFSESPVTKFWGGGFTKEHSGGQEGGTSTGQTLGLLDDLASKTATGKADGFLEGLNDGISTEHIDTPGESTNRFSISQIKGELKSNISKGQSFAESTQEINKEEEETSEISTGKMKEVLPGSPSGDSIVEVAGEPTNEIIKEQTEDVLKESTGETSIQQTGELKESSSETIAGQTEEESASGNIHGQTEGESTSGPTHGQTEGESTSGPTHGQTEGESTSGPTHGQTEGESTSGPTHGQTEGESTSGPTHGQTEWAFEETTSESITGQKEVDSTNRIIQEQTEKMFIDSTNEHKTDHLEAHKKSTREPSIDRAEVHEESTHKSNIDGTEVHGESTHEPNIDKTQVQHESIQKPKMGQTESEWTNNVSAEEATGHVQQWTEKTTIETIEQTSRTFEQSTGQPGIVQKESFLRNPTNKSTTAMTNALGESATETNINGPLEESMRKTNNWQANEYLDDWATISGHESELVEESTSVPNIISEASTSQAGISLTNEEFADEATSRQTYSLITATTEQTGLEETSRLNNEWTEEISTDNVHWLGGETTQESITKQANLVAGESAVASDMQSSFGFSGKSTDEPNAGQTFGFVGESTSEGDSTQTKVLSEESTDGKWQTNGVSDVGQTNMFSGESTNEFKAGHTDGSVAESASDASAAPEESNSQPIVEEKNRYEEPNSDTRGPQTSELNDNFSSEISNDQTNAVFGQSTVTPNREQAEKVVTKSTSESTMGSTLGESTNTLEHTDELLDDSSCKFVAGQTDGFSRGGSAGVINGESVSGTNEGETNEFVGKSTNNDFINLLNRLLSDTGNTGHTNINRYGGSAGGTSIDKISRIFGRTESETNIELSSEILGGLTGKQSVDLIHGVVERSAGSNTGGLVRGLGGGLNVGSTSKIQAPPNIELPVRTRDITCGGLLRGELPGGSGGGLVSGLLSGGGSGGGLVSGLLSGGGSGGGLVSGLLSGGGSGGGGLLGLGILGGGQGDSSGGGGGKGGLLGTGLLGKRSEK